MAGQRRAAGNRSFDGYIARLYRKNPGATSRRSLTSRTRRRTAPRVPATWWAPAVIDALAVAPGAHSGEHRFLARCTLSASGQTRTARGTCIAHDIVAVVQGEPPECAQCTGPRTRISRRRGVRMFCGFDRSASRIPRGVATPASGHGRIPAAGGSAAKEVVSAPRFEWRGFEWRAVSLRTCRPSRRAPH